MSESSSPPNPDLVYDLQYGGYSAEVFRTALLLDVFTPLADGPASAETVARVCGCDTIGMRALLDVLTSVHLFDRQDDTYTLTPTTATFLVPREKSYSQHCTLEIDH